MDAVNQCDEWMGVLAWISLTAGVTDGRRQPQPWWAVALCRPKRTDAQVTLSKLYSLALEMSSGMGITFSYQGPSAVLYCFHLFSNVLFPKYVLGRI